MSIRYDEDIVRLIKKSVQRPCVKIQSLDMNDKILDEITGVCKSGSITITNNDIIRRQISLECICNEKTDIKPDSMFWINKRIKVFLGLERDKRDAKYKTEKIVWFDFGIYVMSNTKNSISTNGNIISVTAKDKMHHYKNCFMTKSVIKVDTPMADAIKGLGLLMHEDKFRIVKNEYVIPYDQEFEPTETILNAIQKFQDMYMNYEIVYDTDGYLVYQPTYTLKDSPIYWTFNNDDCDIEESRSTDFDNDNVYNHIKVNGRYDDDTGLQPSYTLKVTDGEFSIDNIGERAICIDMQDYTNETQCKLYAEYLLENTYKLGKKIVITCLPIYFMNDVNFNISVINNKTEYICCVDEIVMPLGVGSMTITCHVIAENDINCLYESKMKDLYKTTTEEMYKMPVTKTGKTLY